MKILCIIFIFGLFNFGCNSEKIPEAVFVKDNQETRHKIDSLSKINFTVLDYEYFDADFNIKPISSKEFQKKVKAMNLGKRRNMNYTDSIHVLFFDHFQDWDAARIATYQIIYTWETVGFYIWMNEEEIKRLGESMGFRFPSLFLDYLETDPEIQWFQDRKRELRAGLKEKLPELNVDELSVSELLRQCFHNSEVRLEKYPHKH
ncbi:hypothetical protein ACFOUP_07575 [Belliella kenyensis]|uniref:Uncharacterized protein n=1 Tax=Belliella kenyensis TaxID=1472724 RepID=A0ABV8EJH5_9BACT|nr:hypothetical protein [Belliella kenyensis]MCH7400333.1 hypothetical protein [Belliella kenyensis]MDN3604649.1 hypothetical protein [Belliella kenyensis]